MDQFYNFLSDSGILEILEFLEDDVFATVIICCVVMLLIPMTWKLIYHVVCLILLIFRAIFILLFDGNELHKGSVVEWIKINLLPQQKNKEN